jgi:hypothetical protein
MRTRIIVAATLLVVAATGCSSHSPTTPSEPGSFVLAPGQSISYGSLTVRFVGVPADSRCPGDAMCLQFVAGDATVALDISSGGSSRRSELLINDSAKRRVSQSGFVIELTQLSPYPFVSRPIAPGDYRATIVISPD